MWSFARKHNNLRFGAITPSGDGMSIVAVTAATGGKVKLPVCEYIAWDQSWDEEKRQQVLKSSLRERGMEKLDLATSLDLGDYTLLSVDAPDVPPNELRAAVRWQIKDLIDFHIDDAVLDVFDAPASGAHGQQQSIYVVVSRRSQLESRIEPFHAVDANLTVVDIPELLLRNIASNLQEDDQGVVMLYFSAQRGVLTLTRQSTLYLARSLDFGYERLAEQAEQENHSVERLSLEIQRSLDYYDRYFNQAPIRSVIISPLEDKVPAICGDLENLLGLSCRFLDLQEIVELENELSADQQQQCLLSVAAALRREPRKL